MKLGWIGVGLSLVLAGVGIAPVMAQEPACPLVVVHRTNPLAAPENTVAGVNSVRATGALWFETDVRWSANNNTEGNPGFPVFAHDPTVDRTTTFSGPVNSFGVTQLTQMDATAFDPWNTPTHRAYSGATTIPYAWSMFNAANQHGLSIVLDVQETPGEWNAKKLLEYLDRWPGMRSRVWYMSKEAGIRAMRTWAGDTLRYVFIEYPPTNRIETGEGLKAMGASAYAIPASAIHGPEIAGYVHAHGLELWTWTSDPGNDTPSIRADMRAAGADVIVTNEPAKALSECVP